VSLKDKSEYVVTLPEKTVLYGNYPNPFNPETVIKWSVGSDQCSVSIEIFNIKGQKVKNLVDGMYSAGVHTVVWNGQDDHGRHVGSGIYFYRLKAGDFTETKKMLLVK